MKKYKCFICGRECPEHMAKQIEEELKQLGVDEYILLCPICFRRIFPHLRQPEAS